MTPVNLKINALTTKVKVMKGYYQGHGRLSKTFKYRIVIPTTGLRIKVYTFINYISFVK